jgi:hypothetical protein
MDLNLLYSQLNDAVQYVQENGWPVFQFLLQIPLIVGILWIIYKIAEWVGMMLKPPRPAGQPAHQEAVPAKFHAAPKRQWWRLWSNFKGWNRQRRGRGMVKKVRSDMVKAMLGNDICELIETRVLNGDITREEATYWYRRMAWAHGLWAKTSKRFCFHPHPDDLKIDIQGRIDEYRANPEPLPIPGDKPIQPVFGKRKKPKNNPLADAAAAE